MAAIAPLTIADGATTPVNHTYSPVSISKDTATWKERLPSGKTLGWPQIEVDVVDATKGANVNTVNVRVQLPVVVTADGVDVVDYVAQFQGRFLLPVKSTTQNRKDLIAQVKNLLAHAAVNAAIVDLEHIY